MVVLTPFWQGQRVSLLGKLGRAKPGDHQLRQHRLGHAHSLPVRHHGGLDPHPLLGEFHLTIIFTFSPILILVIDVDVIVQTVWQKAD